MPSKLNMTNRTLYFFVLIGCFLVASLYTAWSDHETRYLIISSLLLVITVVSFCYIQLLLKNISRLQADKEDLKEEIMEMQENVVDDYMDMYLGEGAIGDESDFQGLIDWGRQTFLLDISGWTPKPENMSYDEIRDKLLKSLKDIYEQREQQMGSDVMRRLERYVMLDRIDDHWVDHLYNMDYMEDGIGLRAYGHKDPLVEFKREGHDMFSAMIQKIKEEVVEYIYKVRFVEETEKESSQAKRRSRRPQKSESKSSANVEENMEDDFSSQSPLAKIGRNDPCPCGSGKKYKKCCGR